MKESVLLYVFVDSGICAGVTMDILKGEGPRLHMYPDLYLAL